MLLGLSACVTVPPRAVPEAGTQAGETPAAATNQPAKGLTDEQLKTLETGAGDYLLGAGDVVQLYAMDVAELNRNYVIGPDGKITVPGVGVVSLDQTLCLWVVIRQGRMEETR